MTPYIYTKSIFFKWEGGPGGTPKIVDATMSSRVVLNYLTVHGMSKWREAITLDGKSGENTLNFSRCASAPPRSGVSKIIRVFTG